MKKVKPRYHLDQPDTDIYVGDNRKILPQLNESGFDLIFADPPFNWQVNYDKWRDNMPRQEYLHFTYHWLDECIRVLAPHGSLWVNIPDDTAAEIVIHLKNRGLTMINWCIWHFRFGQCRNTNFIVSKVHVLYFAKDPKNRIWNAEEILEPSDRATTYADRRTRNTRTPGMRAPLDVWYGPFWGRIQGANLERRNSHQNQIPEAYLERVIRACSNEGDLVLDPFLGSGTTCTVARALKRRSIGIEYSDAHAKSAFQRIKNGPIRLENPEDRAIKKAFFATHHGLGVDEVLCDDELLAAFNNACRKELPEWSEFNCNYQLWNLYKNGKLNSVRRRYNADNTRQKEKILRLAEQVKRIRKNSPIERILCDPKLRKNFDKKILALFPKSDLRLARKAALSWRKKISHHTQVTNKFAHQQYLFDATELSDEG